MKTSTSLAGLLAAGLISGMPAAHADGVGFQTRLSNVALGVTDLTPHDGTAAHFSYTFVDSVYEAALYGPGDVTDKIRDTTSGSNPVDHAVALGASSAAVQATGNPGEISLQGQALSNLGVDGGAAASAWQEYTVILGAHSALTFSGHLFQQIAPLAARSPYQEGTSTLYVSFKSDDLVHYGGYSNFIRLPWDTAVVDRDLWLAYANPTDRDVTVTLTIDASSFSFIQAVPEPSTYAMLGLGLLVVGAVARRRANRN